MRTPFLEFVYIGRLLAATAVPYVVFCLTTPTVLRAPGIHRVLRDKGFTVSAGKHKQF